MAETTIYFVAFFLAIYTVLRVARAMKEMSKKRADDRLRSHLNWREHPRKPAV